MRSVRRQPRGLVHPQVRDAGQPGGVLDQGAAVSFDGAHGRGPADAVLAGHFTTQALRNLFEIPAQLAELQASESADDEPTAGAA